MFLLGDERLIRPDVHLTRRKVGTACFAGVGGM
jgi:hypothetical protein